MNANVGNIKNLCYKNKTVFDIISSIDMYGSCY